MSKGSDSFCSNTCIVCYKNVDIFSIGMCEHPVCYECSTRMRVLCQQNECPICRQDLPKVVFTREQKPFRHLRKGPLVDERYNIFFENLEIQERFTELLAHSCSICPERQVLSSFTSLNDHMRRKHDRFFCELCVDNLKIFSHERRSYSRHELNQHLIKGDLDDKSHKGHPQCKFCVKRYMDNDELYRHLRRDHLYCHYCDADGLHQYYSSYDYLREHFRHEHYLCEEGSCAEEKFTSVFRTNIDLKAHKATIHGRQMGKAAAKQARTLELEFTLAPRGDNRYRRGMGPPTSRSLREQDWNPREQDAGAVGGDLIPQEMYVQQPLVDVQSTEQFPSLGNSAPIIPKNKGRGNVTIRSTLRQPLEITDENFPVLGPEPGNSGISKTVNLSVSSTNKYGPSGTQRQQNSAPTNVSIHVNHKANGTNIRIRPTRDSEFPALGRAEPSTSNSNTSQWTKITCVKPAVAQKSKKVAPAPLSASPPTINSGEDFPTLLKSSKYNKQSTISVVPSSSSWEPPPPTTTQTDTNTIKSTSDATKGKAKKKKVKQNGNLNIDTPSAKKEESKKCEKKKSPKKDFSQANDSPNDQKPLLKKDTKNKQKTRFESCLNSSNYEIKNEALDNNQRKRSEFKIDSLNSTNNNRFDKSKDFPALSSGGSKPPGFTNPPPGFSTTVPPPGFFVKLNNVKRLQNDNGLTFTNSSGESYSIIPDNDCQSKNYPYISPPDFQRRNRQLVEKVNQVLDQELIDEFRFVSGLYRQDVCNANDYYERCRAVMGTSIFESVFTELLVLLPDIKKQQELFKVHKKEVNGQIQNLELCATCGQILTSADLQSHLSNHTFPALGEKIAIEHSNKTWVRK